jgi:5-methyltetrahydrofolate--homocysteine methyltransferase
MNNIIQEIYAAVVDGQNSSVQQNVKASLEQGLDPDLILNQGLIAAMSEVGRRFEEGDFFVPEMLIAARAMQSGLALLKPHLQESSLNAAGKVVIGTVKGDLHDIGKNLVAMMLEGAGFEIIDLGADVAPERFVDAIRSNKADILALSALLTTTMTNIKTTIEVLEASNLRQEVRVIVGGAPVTESFAKAIHADGYAPDASRAVALAKALLTGG